MRRCSPRACAAALLLAVPALALFPGCLNDDDSPGDGTLDEAENETAASLAEMGIALEQLIAESVPQLFAEGFGTALRDEAVVEWSDETDEWVVTFSESYEDEEATGEVHITQHVQFRADGVPVQYPDENTDEVQVDVEGSNAGNYHPTDRWNVDFDVDVARAANAARETDGSILITGEGTAAGAALYHVGGRSYPRQTSFSWSGDLAYAPGNPCVAGAVAGTNGRLDLEAAFDGAGTVSWEVTREGQVVRTGSEEYVCTGPETQ
jgi:hypothetical protein